MKNLKRILTSLLSIIMCFSVFKITSLAETTPTYFNTTHFQMTQSHENFNVPNTSGGSSTTGATFTINHLVFNTKNNEPYSGTLTLNYSYSSTNVNQNLANWEILCNGCVITTYTNTSGILKIKTYGNTTFSIDLVYRVNSLSSGLANPFTFSSMTESSVSAVTNPIETDVDSIDTKLTTTNSTLTVIQGKIDTANANLSSIITNTNDIETFLNQHDNGQYYDTDIETLLSGCKTELTSINNYTSLNESLLNNIAGSIGSLANVTNGETIVSCINTIKNSQTQLVTNTNNIYSVLSTITTNQNTIISSLSSMGADLSSIATTIANVNTTSANIYSAILSMKTTLEGYEQYIDNIEGLISTQNNLVSSVNNKIDSVNWSSYSNNYLIGFSNSTDSSTASLASVTPIYDSNTQKYLSYIHFNSSLGSYDYLYKIHLPITIGGISNGLELQLSVNGAIVDYYYINSNRLSFTDIYIKMSSSTATTFYITLSSDRVYTLDYRSGDAALYSLNSNSSDYWELINIFSQIKENNRVYSILKTIEDNQIDYTTYLNTVNALLTNLNSAQKDYTSILNNIESEVDGVEELLGILTAALSIEGAGIFAEIGVGVQEIVAALSVTNAVDGVTKTVWDLIKELLDVSADVSDITENINNAVSNIVTSVNNIDNLIDGITWNSYTNNYLLGFSNTNIRDNALLQSVTSVYDNNKNAYVAYVIFDTFYSGYDYLYKIKLPFTLSGASNNSFNYRLLCDTATIEEYYINTTRYNYTELYVKFRSSSNVSPFSICIACNKQFTIDYRSDGVIAVSSINNNDIEYWQLLSYFNQYRANNEILKGLLIDVDTETSITQYNRDHETITEIESDLTTLFNETKPYVDSQLAPLDNETLFTKLRKGRSLFDYIFRGVWNTDSSVTVPDTVNNPIFLIIIFAGVFLAIVG